jgi:hypothetical protein
MKQQDIILKSIDHQLEIFTEQYLMAREHGEVIPLIEIDLMKHSIRTLYQQLQNLQQIVQAPLQSNLEQVSTAPVVQFKKENTIESPISNSPSIEFSEPILVELKTEETNSTVEENKIETESIDLLNKVEEINSTKVNEEITFRLEQETAIEQLVDETSNETENLEELKVEELKVEELKVEELKVEELKVEVIAEQPSIEIQEEPVIEEEIVFEVAPPTIEKPIQNNPQPVVVETKKAAPVMMASLFDEAPITVASKFKEQESVSDNFAKQYGAPTIAERLSVKPVVDLKKSIGINERFSFINELFSGNQQLFMESIDKINNQSAYEEARRILYEELAGRMNWNISTKPFSDLDDLVKRRFNA